MLNPVLDLLSRQGWFDVSQPFEATINLTRGACIWLLLTRGGVSDTYVKFSSHVSLEAEARRCAEASRCYPVLVPRFVGHGRVEDLDVLVCRAVEYRGLSATRLQHGPTRDRIFHKLGNYFAAMPEQRLPPSLTPLANAGISQALNDYFRSAATGPLAQRWLACDAMRLAAALPAMPQHGDLVLNNLGLTEDGAVVVFDWEDFGMSCLPGLDLFTFELSMADDPTQLLQCRRHASVAAQRFTRQACAAMGIDVPTYEALTPVYALVFRYLKRNYGPGVRERMDQLLLDLDRQLPVAGKASG